MVRTQIYLTETEHKGLRALARATGRKQSELIREAVDGLIAMTSRYRREAAILQAAGMWKDRGDLPDFRAIRQTLDRR